MRATARPRAIPPGDSTYPYFNHGYRREARMNPGQGLKTAAARYQVRSGGTVAMASSNVVRPSFTLSMLSW